MTARLLRWAAVAATLGLIGVLLFGPENTLSPPETAPADAEITDATAAGEAATDQSRDLAAVEAGDAPEEAGSASSGPGASDATAPAAPAPGAGTATPDRDTAMSAASQSTETAQQGDTEASDAAGTIDVDLFRVEPDGSGIVAGSGRPGARFDLLLDGQVVGDATAGDDGGFVSFFTLPASDAPQVLRLSGEGASSDSFMIQPLRAPSAAPAVADANVDTPEDARPETAGAAARSLDAPSPTGGDPATALDAGTTDVVAGLTPDVATPTVPPLATGDAGALANDPSETAATEPGGPAGTPPPPSVAAAAQPAPGPDAPSVAVDTLPDAPEASAPPVQTGPVATATAPVDAAPPAAPRVIRAGRDGVAVVQDGDTARPEALSDLSIDTITYADGGAVRLGGRGNAGGQVRVYVDNAPVELATTAPDGQWRADLPRLDPRVYTLRVDQIDADGRVISRAETPFRPETQSALARLERDADGNEVALVTVQPGFTLWRIADENYGDGFAYVRVFDANSDKIRDPDLIYPGQVFTVPQ